MNKLILKRATRTRAMPAFAAASLIFGSLVFSHAPAAEALGDDDADLVVSFEEPGIQQASFTDVAITVERFGNASACTSNPCGLDFDDSDFTTDVGTFSGGFSRLAGDEKAGTAFAVENKTTNSPRERMVVVKDAGGGASVGVLQIDNTTSDLKYLGFWWGSGNTGANQNVIRFYRDGDLVADFDAGDIDDNLNAADGDFGINDYLGNPNFCWPQNFSPTPPTAVTCAATNETRPDATSSNSNMGLPLPSWVIAQPYVFIHFRLDAGFDQVQFQRSDGGGFEMDNLTVAREIPGFTDSEVASTTTFTLDATDLLLADPRDPGISFNGVELGGTSMGTSAAANLVTNATICIAVVQDSVGSTVVASPNLNISATASGLSVSSNMDGSRWALSGTKGTVAANSATVSFQTSDSSALVLSGETLWLRIGVMNGSVTPAQCASSQSNNTLGIRGLTLSSSRAVSIDIDN